MTAKLQAVRTLVDKLAEDLKSSSLQSHRMPPHPVLFTVVGGY